MYCDTGGAQMKKWREKIAGLALWKPDLRATAIVAMVLLVLLLVPLVRLSFYAAPWYDDYGFGQITRDLLSVKFSLGSVLKGAMHSMRHHWYAWQGTYSTSFLNTLMPAIWGEEYYFLGPLFLILILPFSAAKLVKALLRDVLKADRGFVITVQSVVAAAVTVLIYSAQDGFYFYVGGMSYVGMHSFLMLLTAAWIKLLAGKGKVISTLLALCTLAGALVVAGGTYTTALQGLLIGGSIFCLGCILRKKRVFLLLPSVLLYVSGFCMNVFAPGNEIRRLALQEMNSQSPKPNALNAIIMSFVEAFRHVAEFSGMITLLILIMLIPVIWQGLKRLQFRFRYPALILAWSFCLYAAGFTPGLYALGSAGLARNLNTVKITWQILLFMNEVYWLGWLQGKLFGTEEFILLGWQCRRKGDISGGALRWRTIWLSF